LQQLAAKKKTPIISKNCSGTTRARISTKAHINIKLHESDIVVTQHAETWFELYPSNCSYMSILAAHHFKKWPYSNRLVAVSRLQHRIHNITKQRL
jgi:hypothetical protein